MELKEYISVLLILSAFLIAYSEANPEVGTATTVTGRVLIRNDSDKGVTKIRPLKRGGKIFQGDVLNTGSTSKVKLLFKDKTIVDLGPSTLFKVREYKLSKTDRQVDVAMDYGKARIAVNKKLKRKSRFKVRTKTATMGVRGTEILMQSGLDSFSVGKESRYSDANKNELQQGIQNESRGDTQASGSSGSSNGSNASNTHNGKTQIVVVEGKVELTATVAKSGGSSGGSETKTMTLTAGNMLTMDAIAASDPTGGTRDVATVATDMKVESVQQEEISSFVNDVKTQDQTFDLNVNMDSIDAGGKGGDLTLEAFNEVMDGKNRPELNAENALGNRPPPGPINPQRPQFFNNIARIKVRFTP